VEEDVAAYPSAPSCRGAEGSPLLYRGEGDEVGGDHEEVSHLPGVPCVVHEEEGGGSVVLDRFFQGLVGGIRQLSAEPGALALELVLFVTGVAGEIVYACFGCGRVQVCGITCEAVHVVLEPLFGDDAGDLGGGFVGGCHMDGEINHHLRKKTQMGS